LKSALTQMFLATTSTCWAKYDYGHLLTYLVRQLKKDFRLV